MEQSKKKAVVGIVVCAILLVICLIINVVFASLKDTIAMFLGGYTTSSVNGDGSYDLASCYSEGYNVSMRVGEEGSVLLKNSDNSLPLAKGDKVTLLGAMTYNYIIGGEGSAGGKDDNNTITPYKAFSDAGLSVNDDVWQWLVKASGGARRRNTDPAFLASGDPGVTSSAWVGYQNINEFTRETYEQFVKPSIGSYKTALVMFSRTGAEGASPTMDIDNTGSTLNRTILELGDNEYALLEFAKENFDKTIVLLNSATPLECGFLNEEKYRVDACLWMGLPGEAGIMGTANVVAGKSPSGALADTYAYDMTTNPTYYNMDNNEYANAELKTADGKAIAGNGNAHKFYQYEEGIYVGYKYYETAAAEGYFDSDAFKAIEFKNGKVTGGYDQVVQFPFGYGLSYTTFSQKIVASDVTMTPHGTNSITVRVTNTGSTYTGKEIVQLYVDAPYASDTNNFGIKGRGLEKSKVSLVAFGKTKELAPGASEDVVITFETDEIASYDNFGQGCYVLENGTYKFNIQDNAHCWAESGNTAYYDSVSFNLAHPVIFKEKPTGPVEGIVDGAVYAVNRNSDANTARNAMDDVTAGDGNMLDGYLSRSNISDGMASIMRHQSNEAPNEILAEGISKILLLTGKQSAEYTFETYINGVKKTITKTYYAHGSDVAPYMTTTVDGKSVNDESYKVDWGKVYYVEEGDDGKVKMNDDGTFAVYENPSEIASGKYHKLSVDDMGYVPATSNIWDMLASMTTLEEAITLQGVCSYRTTNVDSVGKKYVTFLDGPAEVANGKYNGATWWPCAVLLASTFNTDLVNEIGVAYGHQSALFNLGGTYGPSMNTHRSPFGGRNFEYFSEDGVLAGEIGGSEVAGIQSTGTSVTIKHFAINDNDTNRQGVCTWANEQAIREIYARPFEISVKKYEADGIMAAMNRIGTAWSHYGFHTTMVQHDWGFDGFMITDGDGDFGDVYNSSVFFLYGAEGGILHVGLFVNDPTVVAAFGDGSYTTNYGQYKLQQTMKHSLYQYAHSGKIEGTRAWWWVSIWVAQNILFAAAIVLIIVFKVVPGFKGATKKENK